MSRHWAAACVVLAVCVSACRRNASRLTTECIPLAAPSGSAARNPPRGTKLAPLPRFARIWSREDLHEYVGVGEDGVYYAPSNDYRRVVALDVGSGKTRWETELPESLDASIELGVGRGAVLVLDHVAGRQAGDNEAGLRRLSARDGTLAWSKRVACTGASLLHVRTRTYLACGLGFFHQWQGKGEVVEIDTHGNELARVPVSGKVRAHADGTLCGARESELWCGKIAAGALKKTWAQPAPIGTWDVHIAGDSVLAFGEGEVVARGIADGQSRWRREGQHRVVRGDSSRRVVLMHGTESTLVDARDGRVLDESPSQVSSVHSRGERLVVAFPGGPVRILDGASRVREVAANVLSIRHVDGDVMFAQSVGMYERKHPLEAFSLVSFAPSLDEATGRDRVQGILQRYDWPPDPANALSELRHAPDWEMHLASVMDEGPIGLHEVAIAVAGESADPRFLPSLQKQLDRMVVPYYASDLHRSLTLIDAVRDIDSPNAAAMLVSFWNARRTEFGASELGIRLGDAAASAAWRYGGLKQRVSCGDTTFPVVRVSPGDASLGTAHPALAGAVDKERRWGVVCQAREDTNRDGRIELVTLYNGEPGGDEVRPYLVLGSGEGTVIDDFVADDPSGRWVVVTKDLCVTLVDTTTGKSVSLEGADGREGNPIVGGHRAASFSPDGKSVLYIRTNGAHSLVVQRNLVSGAERILDPGAGLLASAMFDGTGRWVVMDVVVRDTNGDGRMTWPGAASTVGSRRCRAQSPSPSSHGMPGDQPVRRFVAADGGTVEDAAADRCFERVEVADKPHRLDTTGPRSSNKLPLGPMVWKPR